MKWEKVEIGGISRVISGYPFKSQDFRTTGIPVIKIKNIKNENIVLDDSDCVDSAIEVPERFHLSHGDILISLTGSHITLPSSVVGRVAKYRHETNSYLNQRAGKFIDINSEKCFRDYLFYAVLQKETTTRIALKAQGAANQANISPGDVEGVEINLPPLPTQRRIASILSAYDDLIENNLKRIKLLEEKAFLSYKLIVKSKKLEEFTIEDVCETLGGGTPATGNRQFWDEGEIIWFSPTDLTKHNSFVLLDSEKKITELGLQKSSAKLFPPKTILMTSRASIGYFGLINKPASTNQGFINIIPFKEFHRAFMLFDLKNRKEEIIGNANGATFLEISKGKFRQMKIKLPRNERVLIEFENEFEFTFNLIENLLKQNAKLREARDILLPRLMSGEIEV